MKKIGIAVVAALATFCGLAVAQSFTEYLNVRIYEDLEVQGVVFNDSGDATVDDNLVVTGTSDFQGSVFDSLGTLVLNDAVQLNGSLDISGPIADFDSALHLNDDTDITGTLDVTGAVTGTGNMWIESDFPELRIVELDQTPDAVWGVEVRDGLFGVVARSEAESFIAHALRVDADTDSVTDFDITADDITLNGVSWTDFARLSQANTFTGLTQTIETSASPGLAVIRTTHTSNAVIEATTNGGSLFFGNDDGVSFSVSGSNNLGTSPWFSVDATTAEVAGSTVCTVANGLCGGGGGGAGAITAHKTADTARSSTTAETADPHLSVPVTIGQDYIFEAFISVNFANGAGGLSLAVPAAWLGGCKGSADLLQSAVSIVLSQGSATFGFCSGSTGMGVNPSAGGTAWVMLYGSIIDASDSTFTINWAQQVSDAGATTLEEGSWLRVTPL